MSKVWLTGGRVVLSGGKVVLCANCPCGCDSCSTQPGDTIDVEFAMVADEAPVECADCTAYNSTTYTLSNGTSCGWSGWGECGHWIVVIFDTTEIVGWVLDGADFIGVFTKAISGPYDCTATHTLTFVSSDPSSNGCDFSSSTMTINP